MAVGIVRVVVTRKVIAEPVKDAAALLQEVAIRGRAYIQALGAIGALKCAIKKMHLQLKRRSMR
jgi:stage V sporulation protein SpoVS